MHAVAAWVSRAPPRAAAWAPLAAAAGAAAFALPGPGGRGAWRGPGREYSDTALRAAAILQEAFEGMPVLVAQTPRSGRGLFALGSLPPGHEVFSEAPVTAHPTAANVGKSCYNCLKPLPFPAAEERLSFCSPACQTSGHKEFYRLEGACDFTELKDSARGGGQRFPLLAARLACKVLMGSADPLAIAPLCFANVPPPYPAEWMEEHRQVRAPFEAAGLEPEALAFLTPEWYVGVVARMHLNSFRVDIPRGGGAEDWEAALAAQILAREGGDGGTGVYLRGSFFNHSCEPNVEVSWPAGTCTAMFSTRRHVEDGEELTITYIDSAMEKGARQEFLRWNYGFMCQCPRCQEEEFRV